MLAFDLETDGLYDTASKIHTLSIYDDTTNRITRYDKQAVAEGLQRLSTADCICGHNIINFDVPVIEKLYPQWNRPPLLVDTLVWARLVCGNIKETDYDLFNKGRLPGGLIGSQSLEAWGYRLGLLKGTYGKRENAWEKWTPEMSAYCEQDVKVTVRLYAHLNSFQTSQEAFELEHGVATIISRQERRGVRYNKAKAQSLYESLLLERVKALSELQLLSPFYLHGGEFTPKKDNKKLGYFKDAPMCKLKLTEFNPNSRTHVALLLHKLHKWKPEEWNEKEHSKLLFEICGWKNTPIISEEILNSLPYPEAKLISRYMTIVKRLSQIVEGEGAWEKYYNEKTGCIHGGVNTNGAVTGRMTHFAPNLAQVPASYSPWGAECRELFEARPGYKLVGCDASGLEARILAHFLARYDGGAYVKTVTEGRKEDKTDVHNLTLKALGPLCKDRDTAKTFLYA